MCRFSALLQLLVLPWFVIKSHDLTSACRSLETDVANMQTSCGNSNDIGHVFLQVQQRTGAVETAIDASGESLSADGLQTPTTTKLPGTTPLPCAMTTTQTFTTTTSGQIHPADILRRFGDHQRFELTDEERALVGAHPGDNMQTTTPPAGGWTSTTPAPLQRATNINFANGNVGLSPWQVLYAYDRIGPGIHCVMSDWEEWSDCRVYSGDGLNQQARTRKRNIFRGPSREGRECPITMQQEVCEPEQPQNYDHRNPTNTIDQ